MQDPLRAELNELTLARLRALVLAQSGQAQEGLEILERGFQSAVELRQAGEQHGDAAVSAWQDAVESFAQKHCVRPEGG